MKRQILTNSNFQDIVERRIVEAQKSGAFDNLPLHGKPLPNLNAPYDENWWIKKKVKEEGLNTGPATLRVRVQTERWLEHYLELPSEMMVRNQANKLNETIQKANEGPLGPLQKQPLLDVLVLLKQWRANR